MIFSSLLATFLSFQIAIITGFCATQFAENVLPLNFSQKLRINYWALITILFALISLPLLPKADFFSPAAKVWSASSMKSISENGKNTANQTYLSISTAKGEHGLHTKKLKVFVAFTLSILSIFALLKLWRAISWLYMIRKKSVPIRKIGKVKVFSTEKYPVPFSFFWFGEANIVLPQSIIEGGVYYKAAVSHEIQHHRQGDTIWIYVLGIFRFFSFGNPIFSFWLRHLAELQEFACDEALLLQGKVNPQTYASCLLEVAQSATQYEFKPACATGMVFLLERNIIKRRIGNMLNISRMKPNRISQIASVALIAVLLTATAWASKGIVKDRRIDLTQAKELASKAQKGSDFPIVMNDLVLTQMNKFVSTPEGRGFMKDSLARMVGYKGMIEKKLNEYQLPLELMAVPIIESGYQNLGEKNKAGWGAGLWMFIKPTAISYGLKVDDTVDERLNEALLTDAAMRYLKANHLRFRDWNLSTLAYNIGENSVEKAIKKTGSRDAFTLIQHGAENDPGYLPKLMAAIIVMKNPEILD